jgi:glycosyltransferase involved in cell wall biosynthesis
MEKVTLYIPCFNAEKTIKECLDNVMKQTYPIDEIIIIDDGCQDKTMDVVSKYPVRIIKHVRNRGLAAARNTAFKEANNDFVAALDADCAAHSDWLKQLMDCFYDEEVSGVGGILIEKYTSSAPDKWRALHMSQSWGEGIIENPPFLYGSNTVFRKSIVLSVGMYNEIFRNNYEDVCLSESFYDKSFNLIYNPKGIAEHLRQDTTLSVLRTYRDWQYHRNIKFNQDVNFSRLIAAQLGGALDLPNDVLGILGQDWQARDYKLVFIGLVAVFYYPWLNIKYLICSLILWLKNR